MSDKNIDKDIKVLKEISESIWCDGDVYLTENHKQAIENVLSELETYKKIAEKLAEQLEKDYTNCKCCKNLIRHFDMFECKEFSNKKQCIIDWARKEVEKNV